ncbi:30S ribosomal protein S2 [Candidatus Tremblaya phenacola]|uniref:Small ribosomal subunit protein uS2 n=1 Tax=Candidatus Tremblayella phenacoccinincola TaxID=1010676 RepID=A0A2G0V751_9PROT|nr:30S ribosomal protein S2 [Candidatus Tremblaya phenacola]PHN16287.1 30S ribosomal protein S2 [Candidatus Tremblaya phenacola]
MTEDIIKKMLESGVHIGHRSCFWNPKMFQYIYCKRRRVHIIDLSKTIRMLKKAILFVERLVTENKHILFVCTKWQLQSFVEKEVSRISMSFITKRWLGGTLTNFNTISNSALNVTDSLKAKGLKVNRVPDAVVVVEAVKHRIVVREAQRLRVPVIAIVDTNCSLSGIDFPIPANDDSATSVHLILAGIIKHIHKTKAVSKGKGLSS